MYLLALAVAIGVREHFQLEAKAAVPHGTD